MKLAADLGREDGTDPKEFHAKPWDAPKQAGRKGLQLCAQVKDSLHGALSECADPVLQALGVVSVEPNPYTDRLRVMVSRADDVDVSDAAAALVRATGLLRSAVAAAVCRRYAPELVFEVI